MLLESAAIGQTVRHSGYVTNTARDRWNQCGRDPEKSRAKRELDRIIAQRGTITEILHNGFAVLWDDGTTSRCLSHLVERA